MKKGLLHHIEIYVSNLKQTVEFWEWFLEELGYASFQQWESGHSWKLDDTYIVFVQTEDRFLDPPYHRSRVGLNHLAFHATSRQHVDEMTNKLKEREINILYSDKHPFAGGTNYYAVFFEDPDRIKVELVAPE
ncbi:catechol 2,3-dioxygenase-like lactoylglutathione lyase family enzyme [Salirhabdus euzebyi]|uniref:Catechol 2,3-dioxygenase-like lactoylglutathione lyase family enzyme n=1 Tax=Salirhabdus euzebyi TaxID=394506 RepID=A0A841Q2F7_9BACI|nr:VOC family protein [Salirhabdus euzebyi]MBB6452505.1 catechol 2,3-dioxygenase-like lactoylglutathione lyase family enzyme [Salirhabdus euzebyi]